MKLLMKYDWPGNVRELQHVIEHACFRVGAGILEMNHFKHLEERIEESRQHKEETADNDDKIMSLDEVKALAEKKEIKKVLMQTKGNKSQAAKLLKIDRTILYDKIRKYDITIE